MHTRRWVRERVGGEGKRSERRETEGRGGVRLGRGAVRLSDERLGGRGKLRECRVRRLDWRSVLPLPYSLPNTPPCFTHTLSHAGACHHPTHRMTTRSGSRECRCASPSNTSTATSTMSPRSRPLPTLHFWATYCSSVPPWAHSITIHLGVSLPGSITMPRPRTTLGWRTWARILGHTKHPVVANSGSVCGHVRVLVCACVCLCVCLCACLCGLVRACACLCVLVQPCECEGKKYTLLPE